MGKPMGRHPHTHYIIPNPKKSPKKGPRYCDLRVDLCSAFDSLSKSQKRSNMTKVIQNLVKGQQEVKGQVEDLMEKGLVREI